MARSQGVIVSVNAPIAREAMTKKAQQRLRQILGRDTRVILAFLGIIQQHERALLTGCDMTKVDESELDKLTMTALKVHSGCSQRVTVPHDMKARFPRISPNELNECRQTAVAAYEGFTTAA